MTARVEVRQRLDDQEITDVLALVEAATEADGVRPLNEHVMLHLRYGGDPRARSLLLHAGDALAGYAHVDPTDEVEGPSGELVIQPAYRRQGHGRRLLRAVLDEAGGRLRLWAHGDNEAAGALAASLGLQRVRSLWQLRRSLFAPLAPYTLPDGVRLRTFEPGRDEEEWLKVNAAAFAHHPEQGAWSLDDLRRREGEPWFDPAGFFLAVRDERLVGFHWTKIHGSSEHGHEPLGEVYVVGVDPSQQGTGLGKALTLAGLSHLRSRGLAQAMLYVDGTNTAAIRLYESLGFARWDADVMYATTVS
ncbi:mycothiol synthase [Nonomuraea roseoviolacea]|uniref:Mycothiol acetyltransferase n=1 Tax=Nonomuraea roseoviolacea subsp. carminata TaxID=160689 RepID=A0ABT1JXC3_9ACTN|nr:mycothiol synthase [Nonomuraea roseoviolacea]MCP2346413.1 mycothiol synthase [Nonomuraea roseoviolacea subsp. carminata]